MERQVMLNSWIKLLANCMSTAHFYSEMHFRVWVSLWGKIRSYNNAGQPARSFMRNFTLIEGTFLQAAGGTHKTVPKECFWKKETKVKGCIHWSQPETKSADNLQTETFHWCLKLQIHFCLNVLTFWEIFMPKINKLKSPNVCFPSRTITIYKG